MGTPTVAQVRVWAGHSGSLALAAVQIDAAVDSFDREMNALTRDVDHVREAWRGDAASASEAATDSEQQFGNRLGIAILDIADAMNRLAPAFVRACDTARDTADYIRGQGYHVADNGVVTPPARTRGGYPADVPATATADEASALAADNAAAHQRGLVRELAEAGVADADLATRIGSAIDALAEASQRATHAVAVRSDVREILLGRRSLPRDAVELNRLWDGLTASDKAELWNHDRSIGNRDGIPVADRDHFNRRHLVEMQRDARADIARYAAAHPYIVDGTIVRSTGPGGYVTDTRRAKEYAAVTRRLRVLTALERALDDPTGSTPRHLVHLDSRGRVAVAVNNPDTAANVATFVPGAGSNWGNVDVGIDRAQAMVLAAERADPAAVTAVVAWYAYDAPPNLLAASGPSSAAHAAGPLDAFAAGLRATHEGAMPSHNTVIGHSYGTVVVGEAASQGHTIDADDLIFVASPGVGGPDSPSDLHLSQVAPADAAEHVYATTAVNDPIGITEGIHGISPADAAFGGRVFAADPGTPLSTRAHGEYWDIHPDGRMNRSLTAMGQIIAGRGDTVR